MKVSFSSRFFLLCIAVIHGFYISKAQDYRSVTVADADTHLPVAHASIYTKENGHFHSCLSDEQGQARVTFSFRQLIVSHLNYDKLVVCALPDTIFLQPKYQMMTEVVVTSEEPEWIRRKLKEAVRKKDDVYFSSPEKERFAYSTQSISSNNIYRLSMEGFLRMKSKEHRRYAVCVDTALIIAVDSTKLTDTSNLRRMLYEDFMAELDNSFIRSHRFYESVEREGCSADDVRLRFRSKGRNPDDRGWLLIDTIRCVVKEAHRSTGTKTNRQERTDAFLYGFAHLMGYSIDQWTRDYHVIYSERTDGSFYPAEVRYKLYMVIRDGSEDKQHREFNEQTGGGFPNMEATLKLTSCAEDLSEQTSWKELPPSWYIKYNTDADRQKEIELSNLPAMFTLYEDN